MYPTLEYPVNTQYQLIVIIYVSSVCYATLINSFIVDIFM